MRGVPLLIALLWCRSASRRIEVQLKAEWPTSVASPIEETFEFLLEEDTGLAWRFLSDLELDSLQDDITSPFRAETYDAVLAEAVRTAKPLLRQSSRSLSANFLPTALAARMYAPAVEAQRGFRRDAWQPCERAFDTVATVFPSGAVVCSAEGVSEAVERAHNGTRTLRRFPVDAEYPRKSGDGAELPTVLLEAPLMGVGNFGAMHAQAEKLAADGRVHYVLRHAPVPEDLSVETVLSGYGVNLDIRNMEYKNLDETKEEEEESSTAGGDEGFAFSEGEEVGGIIFDQLAKSAPNLTSKAVDAMRKLRDTLLEEEAADGADLQVWQIGDLGLQATTRIMASHDPLRAAMDVSQNFPTMAQSISAVSVPQTLRSEVERNLHASVVQTLPGAGTTLFVNGVAINAESWTFNIFKLLAEVRDEGRKLSLVRRMQLPADVEKQLLKLVYVDETYRRGGQGARVRVDLRKGSKEGIAFINNLEKDARYEMWPDNIMQILYAGWQLASIAKNAYTNVHVIDPISPEGLHAIREIKEVFEDELPVRLGVVLVGPPDSYPVAGTPRKDDGLNGVDVAHLFAALLYDYDKDVAFEFLFGLAKQFDDLRGRRKELAESVFAKAVMTSDKYTKEKSKLEARARELLQEEFDSENNAWAKVMEMKAYVEDKGLPVNCRLMNGILYKRTSFVDNIMQELVYEQHNIGWLIQKRVITPTTRSIFTRVIANAERKVTKWHPILAEAEGAEKVVNFVASEKAMDFSLKLPWLDCDEESEEATYRSANHILLVDLGSPDGRQAARIALSFAETSFSGKMAFIHVPSAKPSAQKSNGTLQSLLNEIVDSTMPLKAKREALQSIFTEECAKDTANCVITVGAVIADSDPGLFERVKEKAADSLHMHVNVLDVLEIEQFSRIGLVTNGRKIPLRQDGFGLREGDLDIISEIEAERLGDKVVNELKNLESHPNPNVLVSWVVSFLSDYGKQVRYDVVKSMSEQMSLQHTFISAEETVDEEEEEGSPALTIATILDPLSDAAPRMLPALLMLRESLGAKIQVVIMPRIEMTELPRKAFYRFVTPLAGEVGASPSAEIARLPRKLVLTIGIDTPESWDVQTSVVDSSVDVDNLRCPESSAIPCGIDGDLTPVEYRLKGLLLAGQCYSSTDGAPPNGLQLYLAAADRDELPLSDTVVMHNLGYWQLKANPGAWQLLLAPGRASRLFTMENPDDEDDEDDTYRPMYMLTSFEDHVRFLRVRKRPGFEGVPLLAEDDEDDIQEADVGLFGFGSSLGLGNLGFTKGAESENSLPEEDVVHVFSLATGKLYERLLKIMMISVVKSCSVKVKFWLFENFLTPAFKKNALLLAKEYGFDVAFVTYKWPGWLRQQTEKQRIIWGYKILFLDVLFPLSVKKIIYVDADQVVRGDLKELRDMDLEGAPYGYTPFCSSREETLGYQFWRSGYWKEHLQGRPYHISALYVVDLERFRRVAVGDTLRAIYDNLSRDPNSLSNLDQDLPNYAQHQVEIFSLPQEWLWCESWCSDESKAASKTIDLCNNPRFKENKLDMARRIIQGELFSQSWDELDQEIAACEARLAT